MRVAGAFGVCDAPPISHVVLIEDGEGLAFILAPKVSLGGAEESGCECGGHDWFLGFDFSSWQVLLPARSEEELLLPPLAFEAVNAAESLGVIFSGVEVGKHVGKVATKAAIRSPALGAVLVVWDIGERVETSILAGGASPVADTISSDGIRFAQVVGQYVFE